MTLIFILLSFIVLSILLIMIVIKLKFRFWAAQPVFHIYDISYYLFYSGIIREELPEKTRYTNFKKIETLTFGKNVKPLDITRFVQLLNRHYLRNGDNQFSPKSENVVPYFEGHNSRAFLSFYKESDVLHDSNHGGEIISVEKPVGVMTSRPVHISITNLKKGTTVKFDAYYVDYLCVDKMWRRKEIAPQLIETHHYNQRLLNKDIQVSIFKREGQLTGIVPLCVFGMHVFSTKNWSKPSNLLAPYSIVECGASNMHHLYDFLKEKKETMDITIMTEPSNLMNLVKTKNVFIYFLLQDKVGIIGCYFFRKSCTSIEKEKEALICFASLSEATTSGATTSGSNNDIFIHGFKQSLSDICLKPGSNYHYVVVEDIGDNDDIIANLKKKTYTTSLIPAAYFFYNYAYPTLNKKKVLVVL